MTRESPTKLFVEKELRFLPFHEMFMKHIKNMGGITSLVFTESGTDYNIAKDFVQVRIETIETDYQALEISTQPTDNTNNFKFCGLYTWLFNSSEELAIMAGEKIQQVALEHESDLCLVSISRQLIPEVCYERLVNSVTVNSFQHRKIPPKKGVRTMKKVKANTVQYVITT